jgi:hypothetical protein
MVSIPFPFNNEIQLMGADIPFENQCSAVNGATFT